MEELQKKYRNLLLMVLPVVGALVSVQALVQSGSDWTISGVLLLLFFVVFFVYRLIIFVRTK